jgi:HAD superfamily hydrolase (TIGR01450 family)
MSAPVPRITARQLIDRHAGLLFDAYGVLVDGAGPLPGAIELVRHLEDTRKPYLVVTNDASKRPETGSRRYRGMGLDLAPERILTSGSLLAAHFARAGLVGAGCVVLGTDDTRSYVAEAGGRVLPTLAARVEQADALVIGDEAGYPLLVEVDAALSLVLARAARGLPCALVLPNPDLVYPKAEGRFGIAAGSLALMFEAALRLRHPERTDLAFARLGKPFAPIFDAARARMGGLDLAMVGDQLETDVRGARAAGIPAVLATWGVTIDPGARAGAEFAPGTRPDFVLDSLDLTR